MDENGADVDADARCAKVMMTPSFNGWHRYNHVYLYMIKHMAMLMAMRAAMVMSVTPFQPS